MSATRVRRWRSASGVLSAAALAGVVLAGHLLGLRVTAVLTGSMHPAVPRGALVVTLPADVDRLRAGQLLVFVPPQPFHSDQRRPVLHRIATLDRDDGRLLATTRGDANPLPDPWRLDLRAGGRPGSPALVVPHAGWLLTGGRRSTALVLVGVLLVARGLPRGTLRLPRRRGAHRAGAWGQSSRSPSVAR